MSTTVLKPGSSSYSQARGFLKTRGWREAQERRPAFRAQEHPKPEKKERQPMLTFVVDGKKYAVYEKGRSHVGVYVYDADAGYLVDAYVL